LLKNLNALSLGFESCHSRVNGNPETGIKNIWIPAFAEILKVQFILHWDLFFGFP